MHHPGISCRGNADVRHCEERSCLTIEQEVTNYPASPDDLRTGTRLLKNLLTDIPGVKVGHADDARLASGVTAILFDKPAVAAIDVRGGGPGTREEAALRPESTVETVDGIALSGGSALGLDSAGGVQAWLAEQGRGFRIRDAVIPIVPGAICFDLLNGGDKRWGRFPPYRDLGYAAAAAAASDFALGSAGAGHGRHDRELQGRSWFGVRKDIDRRAGRGDRCGQCRRQRDGGRRTLVLGGAIRGRRRIWRSRPARLVHAGHAGDAAEGRTGGERRGEHDHRRRRHRCDADQGAGEAARDDRADGNGARDLSGARPARRRRGVCRGDLRERRSIPCTA